MGGSGRYLERMGSVVDPMGGRAKGKRISRPVPRVQDYAAEWSEDQEFQLEH